jgi:type IV pilus assembly protein PilW
MKRASVSLQAIRGVTLVELMIALVLGLIVCAAALAVFVTNRQTYVASENLGRLQEASRVAFELMSRDIREAGGTACGNDATDIVNVVTNSASTWYANYASGLRGYPGTSAFADAPFGTAAGDRVSGTEAIELKSAYADEVTVKPADPAKTPDKIFQVNAVGDLAVGDIALACDATHAAVFQVTSLNSGADPQVMHATTGSTPGNCVEGLGVGSACGSSVGYWFTCAEGDNTTCTAEDERTAYLSEVEAYRWYVGCNGKADCASAAGRSLYRSRVANAAGALSTVSDEIAVGVTDLTFRFLLNGSDDYVANATTLDWSKVLAVDMVVALEGQDRVDQQHIERTLHNIVTLRSRAP